MPQVQPKAPDALLTRFLKRYEQEQQPLPVSFRDLLAVPRMKSRATHALHHYPAKLLLHIPSFLLSSSIVSSPGELVLDPFCGSGTVLLEAILAGRNALGADSNPLARLIAHAKTTPIADAKLKAASERLLARLPASASEPEHLLNAAYWFHPHVRRDLARICAGIHATRDPAVRDFFATALSSMIRDVSLADPRLSVPVRLRADQYSNGHWLHPKTAARLRRLRTINVLREFERRLAANMQQLRVLNAWRGRGNAERCLEDARSLSQLDNGSVAAVISSPPYLGAQKYIRATSLSLTWLGLCGASGLRALEDQNIGREHYAKRDFEAPLTTTGLPDADQLLARVRESNPLRAHIAATYLREMSASLQEVARVLRPGRFASLVVGPSTLCGQPFPTPDYLTSLASKHGLTIRLHLVDAIRSRALMTKRHKTAGLISTESILLLQREHSP